MSKLFVLVIVVLTCCTLVAQPIHDHEFQIVTFDACLPPESKVPTFAKVEIDPIIHSINESEFVRQLRLATDQLNLRVGSSGTLKLKFWFPIEKNACLRAIGFNGLEINTTRAAAILATNMPVINSHSPGQQRQQPQHCVGLVFLTIDNGKIGNIRIANFGFDMK